MGCYKPPKASLTYCKHPGFSHKASGMESFMDIPANVVNNLLGSNPRIAFVHSSTFKKFGYRQLDLLLGIGNYSITESGNGYIIENKIKKQNSANDEASKPHVIGKKGQ